MKERAIPYSPLMVRARRNGLKTNTRRAIRPQLSVSSTGAICDEYWMSKPFGGLLLPTVADLPVYSPYGKSGDRLWTREAWRTLAQHDALRPRDVPVGASIWYEADGPAPDGFGRYRHARFMCRWMSRSLDEVVDIRVERLQDISEADAIAEGTYSYATQLAEDPAVSATDIEDLIGKYGEGRVRCLYAALWESINGPGSWAANPWVWVVTFKVLTP